MLARNKLTPSQDMYERLMRMRRGGEAATHADAHEDESKPVAPLALKQGGAAQAPRDGRASAGSGCVSASSQRRKAKETFSLNIETEFG